VAQAVRDHDEGVPFTDLPPRLIEENMWRAIRHGLDGQLLDLHRGEPYPAREALGRLLEWTAPMRDELGIDVTLPARNAAQRQREILEASGSLREAYAAIVAETRDTYAGAPRSAAEVSR
jgi:carboxylate-amine ligase